MGSMGAPGRAEAGGDLIALGDQPRTRGELAGAAANVARALGAAQARAVVVATGDRSDVAAVLLGAAQARAVVVATGDRYDVAAVLLGAWSAGAVVLLPPSLRPAAVHALAQHAGADLVLAGDGGGAGGDAISIRDILEPGAAAPA